MSCVKVCLFFPCILNTNMSSKGFVLNGVNDEHAQITSEKKWLC